MSSLWKYAFGNAQPLETNYLDTYL